MDYIDILRIVQLCVSLLSGAFVLVVCIKNFVKFLKTRKLTKAEIKAKKVEQKEKELFLELSKKYDLSQIASLQSKVKKEEK